MASLESIAEWLGVPVTVDPVTSRPMVVKTYDQKSNEGLCDFRALDMGSHKVMWIRTKGNPTLGVGTSVMIELKDSGIGAECHYEIGKTKLNVQPIMAVIVEMENNKLLTPVESWSVVRKLRLFNHNPPQNLLF